MLGFSRTFPLWVTTREVIPLLVSISPLEQLWMHLSRPLPHWPLCHHWQERDGRLSAKNTSDMNASPLNSTSSLEELKKEAPKFSGFWKESSWIPSNIHSLAIIIFLEMSGLISLSLIYVIISVPTRNLGLWGHFIIPWTLIFIWVCIITSLLNLSHSPLPLCSWNSRAMNKKFAYIFSISFGICSSPYSSNWNLIVLWAIGFPWSPLKWWPFSLVHPLCHWTWRRSKYPPFLPCCPRIEIHVIWLSSTSCSC